MAGLQVPSYRLPKPQPTPTSPTNTIGTSPAGGTPTGGVNPGGFTNTGPGGVSTRYGQSPGTAPIPGVDPTGKTYSVDPTGKMTTFTPSANPWGGTDWTGGDTTDLYGLGQDRFLGLLRALKGEGMGGPVGMNREPGLTMVGRETPSTMADRAPAEAAAFGRAKDRTAKLGKSALDTLKDKASSMGMAGSTAEGRGLADVVTSTQGQLGEVVRQQAEDQLDRADAIDDRNLSTGVVQRGQDIGQQATDYGGNIQQRGQDFQGAMNNPMQQMIMQLLGSFSSGGGSFMPRLY